MHVDHIRYSIYLQKVAFSIPSLESARASPHSPTGSFPPACMLEQVRPLATASPASEAPPCPSLTKGTDRARGADLQNYQSRAQAGGLVKVEAVVGVVQAPSALQQS